MKKKTTSLVLALGLLLLLVLKGRSLAPSKQVVFDGNSLTAGLGIATQDNYPSQCATLLGPLWYTKNLGVSGQTTVQMAADASQQIDPLLDRKRYTQNVLVAWELTNDLVHGATANEALTHFTAYCRARKAAGWKLIVVTVLPRSGPDVPANFETNRQIVNRRLRQDYRSYADGLVDLAANHQIGLPSRESDPTYYFDGTHLNSAGYAIVARMVRDEVSRVTDGKVSH